LLDILEKQNITLTKTSPITIKTGHFIVSCKFKSSEPLGIIKNIITDDIIVTNVILSLSSEDYSELDKRIVNNKISTIVKNNPKETDDKWLTKFKQINKKARD